MSEENSKNRKDCKYCHESIDALAKVCHKCSRHQNRLIQYFDRIGIIISVFLLVLSFSQFIDARQKHAEAEEALRRAKSAETQMREGSKAMAKVLLAMSNMDGTITGLDVAKFFPGIMKGQAESLLNTINATPEERKDTYQVFNLIKEWFELYKKQDFRKPYSLRLKNLEKQIEEIAQKY